ncbi:cupin domain-containing protein [Halopenitus sp. H-Gu1]|uniref:cupin domain-containing protein n=1 Tax=Halopenitus sp. H-Gu1 TaxID=3242697 RepID=UPI00359E6869
MRIAPVSDTETAEPIEDVHLTVLGDGENVTMQHFRIESGALIEEHSHPNEQVGFLFEGELVFFGDGEERVVEAGDGFFIPGDEPHGVENRTDSPAIGAELFSPPRDSFPWE